MKINEFNKYFQNYNKNNIFIRLSELLDLKMESIKDRCGEWRDFLFSKKKSLMNIKLNELDAVGLIRGYELNKIVPNYNPFPFIDHRLYKVILCGNIVNDRYYDISINDYDYYRGGYTYTQTPQMRMISNISIEIKSITIIPEETEQEDEDNFDYNRDLFEIHKHDMSLQLFGKLIHGPENNLILDDKVREEILMLNEKSIKNVEREIK